MSRPRKQPLNMVDRQRIATAQAEKLRTEAMAEAMEFGPSLVGLLTGIGTALRDLIGTNERMINAANESAAATRGLTNELEALRSKRTQNGHAPEPDDALGGEST